MEITIPASTVAIVLSLLSMIVGASAFYIILTKTSPNAKTIPLFTLSIFMFFGSIVFCADSIITNLNERHIQKISAQLPGKWEELYINLHDDEILSEYSRDEIVQDFISRFGSEAPTLTQSLMEEIANGNDEIEKILAPHVEMKPRKEIPYK